MLPILALFAVAMGTAGKGFVAMRIFHELFSVMFQVRVYDSFVRYVVLINPNLPERDTDPPPSTLIKAGTRKEFLAEYFDKYRDAIETKIRQRGGQFPINKLGEHLQSLPEYNARVENAGLGKTKRLEQIVEALGFIIDGTNVREKSVAASSSTDRPES